MDGRIDADFTFTHCILRKNDTKKREILICKHCASAPAHTHTHTRIPLRPVTTAVAIPNNTNPNVNFCVLCCNCICIRIYGRCSILYHRKSFNSNDPTFSCENKNEHEQKTKIFIFFLYLLCICALLVFPPFNVATWNNNNESDIFAPTLSECNCRSGIGSKQHFVATTFGVCTVSQSCHL